MGFEETEAEQNPSGVRRKGAPAPFETNGGLTAMIIKLSNTQREDGSW